MRIAEAAAASGLTIDTIRYYEKSGMLPPVPRGQDGQRRFATEIVEWLTLLFWLRETGMSMKVMRHYADLVRQGPETNPERKAILVQHAQDLEIRRDMLDRCKSLLDRKINYYNDIEWKAAGAAAKKDTA